MSELPTARYEPAGARAEPHEYAPIAEERDDKLSFLDLLIVIAKHKTVVIAAPLLFAVITALLSLLLPNQYTSSTKILPPQQSQSGASAMLSQLGSVAGLVGGAGGLKNPSDLYVGMLKSRTVGDNIVERFGLAQRFGTRYRSAARQQLERNTMIMLGKDNIITVDVTDTDPKFAAELANGYVEELFKLTRVLALTEASQRRLFFEQQLGQAKDNLTDAEGKARQALQQGGLVKVDEQGRAMLETSARLRAQMAVKEVQIGAMRSFATDANPELQLAQQELGAMKRELAKLEGATGGVSGAVGPNARGMDNLGLLRNLKYHEALYELLAKQYEMAKIDEAKDSAIVQVLDKAIEPDSKSKPKRTVMVVFAGAAGLLFAILYAFLREAVHRMHSDPQSAARLRAFRQFLSWRRT